MAEQLDLHDEAGWHHSERRASDTLGMMALLMTVEGLKLFEERGIMLEETPHYADTQIQEGQG